jgi:hypothetical protein
MMTFEEFLLCAYGPKDEEQKNGDDALVPIPENHRTPSTDNIA